MVRKAETATYAETDIWILVHVVTESELCFTLSVIRKNEVDIKKIDSKYFQNCYLKRFHGRSSIWDWLWRMNKVSANRDEKEDSSKQRFSSCSWYIYKINCQGALVPHIESGIHAEGTWSIAAPSGTWAGEERMLHEDFIMFAWM